MFALFDLLGLRFIPPVRDVGDLLLHRLGPPTRLPVDAVLRSRARPERIREHYDDLLRTAASLKRGWVPASLLITPLKNATPQSPVAAALGEYGRIVRTNFLLVYCADPAETRPQMARSRAPTTTSRPRPPRPPRTSAPRAGEAPADPMAVARRERDAQLRELTDQAHGANLDLGHALIRSLTTVEPADISVAKFFVLA